MKTIDPIRFLCGALTPETIAAVIGDLGDDNSTQANAIAASFRQQLECLVGDEESAVMLGEAIAPCFGCGERSQGKLTRLDDDLVRCESCGMEYLPNGVA